MGILCKDCREVLKEANVRSKSGDVWDKAVIASGVLKGRCCLHVFEESVSFQNKTRETTTTEKKASTELCKDCNALLLRVNPKPGQAYSEAVAEDLAGTCCLHFFQGDGKPKETPMGMGNLRRIEIDTFRIKVECLVCEERSNRVSYLEKRIEGLRETLKVCETLDSCKESVKNAERLDMLERENMHLREKVTKYAALYTEKCEENRHHVFLLQQAGAFERYKKQEGQSVPIVLCNKKVDDEDLEDSGLRAAAWEFARTAAYDKLLGPVEVTTQGGDILVLTDEPIEFERVKTFRGYPLKIKVKQNPSMRR